MIAKPSAMIAPCLLYDGKFYKVDDNVCITYFVTDMKQGSIKGRISKIYQVNTYKDIPDWVIVIDTSEQYKSDEAIIDVSFINTVESLK